MLGCQNTRDKNMRTLAKSVAIRLAKISKKK